MGMPLVLEKEQPKKKNRALNRAYPPSTFKERYSNGNPPLTYAPSEDGKRVSVQEYWDKYYQHHMYTYEYNFGILEVKGMAKYTDVPMYNWFMDLLKAFIKEQNKGNEEENEIKFTNLEIGFIVEERADGEIKVRIPDAGVISADNPIPIKGQDRRYHGIYDISIEMVSDSTWEEIKRDVETKVKEYEAAGVQEYYIIAEDVRWIAFYQRNNAGKFEKMTGDIIRSKVLKGFQFRLKDLWEQPSLIEIAFDPIYKDFVMVEYQAEYQRAERERIEKEKERQRAKSAEAQLRAEHIEKEKERIAKEKAFAKLRELGFDITTLE